MPTYEYSCDDCGHAFEEFQSMSAEALTQCPKCGGKIRRLIGGGAGILFKGSGFYGTDYRSKGYQESAKKDQPSKPNSTSDKKAKENKTESKKSD